MHHENHPPLVFLEVNVPSAPEYSHQAKSSMTIKI